MVGKVREIRESLLAIPKVDLEEISPSDIEGCVRVLRAMMGVSEEEHPQALRLMEMSAMYYSSLKKLRKSQVRRERKQRNKEMLARTAIRSTPLDIRRSKAALEARTDARTGGVGELLGKRHCYDCKTRYVKLHHFYDYLCPACAPEHWLKRFQRCDLRGRTALITGGRVKIGFELAVKMLRDGADVIVTTRFPKDAARRFGELDDFDQWKESLFIYGLDLRDIPGVMAFCEHINASFSALDIVVNNAAQTVHRPKAYYASVMEFEQAGELEDKQAMCVQRGVVSPAMLSGQTTSGGMEAFFPKGQVNEDGLQLDLRETNSWMLELADVPVRELLEVHVINAVAPGVLNAMLRPALERSEHKDRYIINVSAKEGQFGAKHKSTRHPHTNMAKASMNMMTRTCAEDYACAGIYMSSVDTGWVTYEQPENIKSGMIEQGGGPPLDVIDGAARIYDPIVQGIGSCEYVSGQLWVNFKVAPW